MRKTRPDKDERFPARPRIVYMGTPDFAVPALEALVNAGHQVIGVVTQPDRQRGRGRKLVFSPVKRLAIEHGLEVLQPESASDPGFIETISAKSPDLLIVVAYGQILRKGLLQVPAWGAINLHASLLPRYRGAAPIYWVIMNDEEKTGLTAIRMDEGLDTGPILLQEETLVYTNETAGQLHDRLSAMSGDFVLKVIRGLEENRIEEEFQDDKLATYAPKIDKRDSWISWTKSAKEISAFIRAMDPWPGAITKAGDFTIKMFSPALKKEDEGTYRAGRIAGFVEDALEVETGKGVLQVREAQAPGKKRLPIPDFLRGFRLQRGMILGE